MDFKRYINNIAANPKGVFLQNLGLKQTIIKNTFWLTISEAITMAVKFFLFVYIARILGAGEYGKLAFGIAFTGLLIVFSDLGLSKIVNREFARDEEPLYHLHAVLALRSILSLATLILIFFGSLFLSANWEMRRIILVMGVYGLINSFFAFLYSFFRARQKMEYQSWSDILQAVAMTAFCLTVLFCWPSALNLSLAYLLSASFCLLVILLFFHFKLARLRMLVDKKVWRSYLTMSWPIASAVFVGSIYANLDSAMLGFLGQMKQVGWYNAAQKIVDIAAIPAGLLSMSFLPALSRFAVSDPRKLQKTWNYYAGASWFLAWPALLGGWALSFRIIDFIYDPAFFPAVPAFHLLLLAGVLGTILNPFNHALFVSGRQDKVFLVTLAAAVVNVLSNVVLIPLYSLYGAACSMIVSFAVSNLLALCFVLKQTTVRPFNLHVLNVFVSALLASLLMLLIITQPFFQDWHILLMVALAMAIYGAGFLGLYKVARVLNHKQDD
jgi:O-antigen/teichoic acid export membrane protein